MPVDKDAILAGLNTMQAEAVRTIEGPVLILAGAGSGKTRALTHRIAYLMASGIPAENILAVTFTNKASGAIKERVSKLLSESGIMNHELGSNHNSQFVIHNSTLPTMGTFHSICLRILRRDIEVLSDYSRSFVIYDTSDQESLMKSVMLSLGLDIKKLNPKSMLHKISEAKSELVSAQEFESKATEYRDKSLSAIYTAYQDALHKANALDFDDLIMVTVRLFQKHPQILERYQELWRYLLIDEYQDTNHAQYVWANLLAKKYRNIAVVGDDAQSIYGWRAADIRNILDFEKDYPDAKVIMLEQNYRSTQTILQAANKIIGNNEHQKQKNLWTDNTPGDKIIVKEAYHVQEEGEYVVQTIKQHAHRKSGLSNFTVLYRTHAQSRAVEDVLIRYGIPYRILGGLRFYERREIKDILAYLRLIINPSDSVSFRRVANVPARGLGPISLAKKSGPAYEKFVELLEELRAQSATLSLPALLRYLFKKIGYESFLNDKTKEGDERWENVKELLTATSGKELEAFLEEVALVQETDSLKEGESSVSLMTIHSAKGLEFPVVFMIGMEDGIFPHSRSLFDQTQLEEERRLCYVGITRAQTELHMIFCKTRALYGTTQINPPSRFVLEIPEELVEFKPAEGIDAY